MARSTDKSEAPATPAVAAPAASLKPAAAPSAVIYLGPNQPGGGLLHGQVFRGGLPPAAAGVDPALIVALADLPRAKLELADPSSGLSKIYRAAVKAGQGGRP
ncbi:hypothetical protein Deba_1585 [Desulfarculus baarsii DSM 2075]|uniref:Uncharacterized protein n=1 Tax=Desulfarculus baarsii (strain ATCC 33931 / DSM 2075 / LMG 7858 / VKM B-1802 / 2st14) TaxID=644282 RepID=E1QHB0_DESB2|nr:hypothetical protein [Desulfarculus baarsii]ADK84953.1 hypothetical protein Deba_1585 [Desulfarculus baarsii DSM 2075]